MFKFLLVSIVMLGCGSEGESSGDSDKGGQVQHPCPLPVPEPMPVPVPVPVPIPPPDPVPVPVPVPVPEPDPGSSEEYVTAHNAIRSYKDLPPVKWSEEVAAVAEAWAKTLESRDCKMEHSSGSGYGENLAWASGGDRSATDIVNMWAAEEEYYDYGSNTCSKVCGHYTQVVWRKTTEIGCASATCGSKTVWVCNYNPPGNYMGQKPY